ncbi:MAG: hypothetical protein LUD47_01770 [Clostridia bacterium]|nr:hypothetical protein [Clostridia bacterium]
MPNFTIYLADYLSTHDLPDCLSLMPDDDSGCSFTDRFKMRNLYKEIGSETEEMFEYFLTMKSHEVVNRYKWKIENYIEHRDTLMTRMATLTESTEHDEAGNNSHEDSAVHTGDYSTDMTASQNKTESLKGSTESSTSGSTSEDKTHSEFFNPINSTSDNLVNKTSDTDTGSSESTTKGSNQNTSTTEEGHTENTTEKHEEKATDGGSSKYDIERKTVRTHDELFGSLKNNAEIMQLTNDLAVLYEEALAAMDVLFMGVI